LTSSQSARLPGLSASGFYAVSRKVLDGFPRSVQTLRHTAAVGCSGIRFPYYPVSRHQGYYEILSLIYHSLFHAAM